MRWIELNAIQQVNDIKAALGYSLIFKHSTRCSISLMVKRNLELNWDIIPAETEIYFLDLIAYRDVSNYIAELFQVRHESPQALLVKNGKCILNLSHNDITAEEIAEVVAQA